MLLYLDFLAMMFAVPFGFDPRKFEFVAEHGGQLVERDFDFHEMSRTRFAACATAARGPCARLADNVAFVAVALSDAAGAILAKAKARYIEFRHGDANRIFAAGGRSFRRA